MDRDVLLSRTSSIVPGKDTRIVCPECAHTRHGDNRRLPTLSVTKFTDRVVFHCWHCGDRGAFPSGKDFAPLPKPVFRRDFMMNGAAPQGVYTDLTRRDVEFLKSRGITRKTAEHLGLRSHGFGIAFPYGSGEGYKVRSAEGKDFRVFGKLQHLMNIEKITGEELIICEGEIDAASLVEAGLSHAASLPHGASVPRHDREAVSHSDPRLSFLHADEDALKRVTKFILMCDNDDPGRAVQAELARRLSRARCWEVRWPEGCKDANDILLKFGAERLRQVVAEAQPMHIPGLQRAEEFRTDVRRLYAGEMGRGYSTGLASLDRFYMVAPGNWTLVTGFAGSGKSEVVDDINVSVAEREDWVTAYCSMENTPSEHIAKLIEKRLRKRFYPHMPNRMTDAEVEEGYIWVQRHFHFLTDDGSPNIESILERMTAAVMRYGVKNAVIDPFNYMAMPGRKRDDLEIGDMLSMVSTWVKNHEAHLWFVAHPKGMQSPDIIPTGFHVSGGPVWWAKCDWGLSMHRRDAGNFATAKVWKVRRGHLGAIGETDLGYNVRTARYYDLDEVGLKMSHEREEMARRRDEEIEPFWYNREPGED